MIGKTKRQHYVPRHYLKGFSNPNKKEFYLFVYNKENGKVFPSNIKKICFDNYFYDRKEPQTTEKRLNLLEYEFNNVLQNIIGSKNINKLSSNDKEVIAKFIAIQESRTLEVRKILEKRIKEDLSNLVKKKFPNINTDNMQLFTAFLRNSHAKLMFTSRYKKITGEILNKMAWKLCINNTDKPFWSSDNPCIRYENLEFKNNNNIIKIKFGKWENTQLHFPLSDKLLLIFEPFGNHSRDHKDQKVVNITNLEYFNEDQVKIENLLQICNSTQFVFSRYDDFKTADNFLNKNPQFKNKDKEQIALNDNYLELNDCYIELNNG